MLRKIKKLHCFDGVGWVVVVVSGHHQHACDGCLTAALHVLRFQLVPEPPSSSLSAVPPRMVLQFTCWYWLTQDIAEH